MHIDRGEEEAGMKATEHNDERVESRRKFLKTIAATGGAAAVTMSAGGTAVASMQEEPETQTSREKIGYQETRHIKDYYAKAGF